MRDIHNQRVIWEIPRAFPAPSLSPLRTTHNHGIWRYWDITGNIFLYFPCQFYHILFYMRCLQLANILRNLHSMQPFVFLPYTKSTVLAQWNKEDLNYFWLLQSVGNSENPWGVLLSPAPLSKIHNLRCQSLIYWWFEQANGKETKYTFAISQSLRKSLGPPGPLVLPPLLCPEFTIWHFNHWMLMIWTTVGNVWNWSK